MRAILVALVVATAACSEPVGLTIDVVRNDPSIVDVQLYVGEHCPDCPSSMAPPGLVARSTDLYIVNDKRVFSGEWHGDSAGFRLNTKGTTDEHIPILIAVGFDANHTPRATVTMRGITIPAGYGERWVAYLEEASPIVDPDPDVDGERVDVWPRMRTGPQCLMVEHGTSGADTIVPADDTDCDGIAASLECAPFTPNAVRSPPSIDSVRCVTPVPSNAGGFICMLGGLVCSETSPTANTTGCEPLTVDYCAPSLVCAACGTTTGGDWDTCVRGKLGGLDPSTNLTAMGCAVPMEIDGAECADASRRKATLDARAFLARDNGANVKCTDIALSEMTLPLGFHHSLTIGGATLALSNFQPDCKVDVEWSGAYDRGLGNHVLLADLELDNGKHLAVPFIVHANDSCNNNMQCATTLPDPADTIFQCTRPAPSSTTCAGTTACSNGTPCGARCCAIGEACVEGVCQCGDSAHCVGDDQCGSPGPMAGCGTACCGTTSPCPL